MRAATFSVTTVDDAGPGSLRAAVIAANGSADASNRIVLAPTDGSRIVLLTPLDPVTATLTLDGSAVTGLVIDGGELEAVPTAQPFFSTSSDLTVTNASLQNGDLDLGFGTVTFDESGSGTSDADIDEDFLTFVKTGPGTTTLGGVVVIRLFGETRIDEGTLAVTGTGILAAPGHTVGPNGTLAGDVVSGFGGVAGPVTVQGRVAPSTTTGNLDISGPTTFESGSVLEVDVLPGDLGDRLNVLGADVNLLSGSRLEIAAQPADFGAASTVTVLTSTAAINGQFDSFTDYAFLDETLVQTPTSISITLAPNGASISSLATTPNQQRVAQYLTAAAPGASAELQDVLDAIDRSATGELPGLLDAIGGESLTAFATARQMLGERTARSLHRRTRDAAWGEGRAFYARDEPLSFSQRPPLGFRVASASPAVADVDVAAGDVHLNHGPRVRAGAWLDTFGAFGSFEGDPGEADLDALLFGGTLGVDAWIAERVLVGIAAGYARSDVDLDGRDAEVEGDTIHGALYAGWTDPRGFVSGYGRYAYTLQDSTRRIQSSQLSRPARASWDAQDLGAGAEAGITVLSFGTFAVQPIAGLDWLRLTEERYTEKSAGALSLAVAPEDLESLTARVGARLFGRVDMDDAGLLVPELRAFWQREFGDRDRVLRARLVGAPTGTTLGVRGPELPRDVILLGVGWSASVADALQILLDYDALLDSDRVEHQGNLSVRVRF